MILLQRELNLQVPGTSGIPGIVHVPTVPLFGTRIELQYEERTVRRVHSTCLHHRLLFQ